MSNDSQKDSSRSRIINSVKTPLGFFVLVVLIVEVVFGIVSKFSQGSDRTYLIIGMIGLMFLLVLIVAGMAIFKPKSLYGIEASLIQDKDNFLDHILQSKTELPKLPKSSTYTPNDEKEKQRLKIQGDLSSMADFEVFKQALAIVDNDNKLIALDIGCADGYVTFDRFEKFDRFKRVIGVDVDAGQINAARRSSHNYGDKYQFFTMDVTDDRFVADIKNITPDAKGGYDFVFIALTLHHLAYPQKLLQNVFDILKNKGVVVIRDIDDDTKIYYPDDKKIIENVIKISTDSPYTADRRSARKLYHRLRTAGFNKIQLQYYPLDTIGLSKVEKNQLFIDSFSFRGNHIKRLIDKGDYDLKKHYKWICDARGYIKEQIVNKDDFYYLEFKIVALAQK